MELERLYARRLMPDAGAVMAPPDSDLDESDRDSDGDPVPVAAADPDADLDADTAAWLEAMIAPPRRRGR